MLFELQHPGVRLSYPFRYRDPRTGKWVHARYKAEPYVIAERYAEWEITGPAEVHRRGGSWDSFNPFRKIVTHAELMHLEEPQPDMQPTVDAAERLLLALFLRRYVTWCARRRQFAAMNGAARLFAELGAAPRALL